MEGRRWKCERFGGGGGGGRAPVSWRFGARRVVVGMNIFGGVEMREGDVVGKVKVVVTQNE
jgi:hypothetical protein